MRATYKGKYTKLNRANPQGLGMCDYTGFTVRHADLCKQYEYRGRGLVWTGLWVHKKFLDKPNPQGLTPIITVDPVPLSHPRPDPFLANTTTPTLNLDVTGQQNIYLDYNQFNNVIFNFTGVLNQNIQILVPATFNQFFANNLTQGDFVMSMNIYACTPHFSYQPVPPPGPISVLPALIIPPADPKTQTGPFISNDSISLTILPR